MNKTIAMLLLVAAVLLGLGWGVRQYGNSRVASQEASTIKGAISEAVADRKEAVKVDVVQTADRAVATRKVASVVISYREKSKEVIPHYETTVDCSGSDAARLRVFLDAASEINRVVDSTSGLP